MNDLKKSYTKEFINLFFPNEFVIDIDSLIGGEEVSLCYLTKTDRGDNKVILNKYYESEYSHYFIMEVYCPRYHIYDEMIKSKDKDRMNNFLSYAKEKKVQNASLVSKSEFIIKVSKIDSMIRMQSWYHQINLNGAHKEKRCMFYRTEWLGRVRFDVEKKHTLIRYKVGRGKKRASYLTQYLSLLNYKKIRNIFDDSLLDFCLKENDPSGLIGKVGVDNLSKYMFLSNKERRVANNVWELLSKKHNYKKMIPKKIKSKGVNFTDMILSVVPEDHISKLMLFIKTKESSLNNVYKNIEEQLSLGDMVSYGFVESGQVRYFQEVEKEKKYNSDNKEDSAKWAVRDYNINKLLYSLNAEGNFCGYDREFEILVSYYRSVLTIAEGEKFDDNIVKDYIKTSRMLGRKINLKIKSYKRLEQEHNDIAVEYSLKNIKGELVVSEDFINIELEKVPGYEITLINKSEDLVLEGKLMRHCVATYFERINRGENAIYHIDKIGSGSKGWTIEIARQHSYGVDREEFKFTLNQVRGVCNSEPPKEVKDAVKKAFGFLLEIDESERHMVMNEQMAIQKEEDDDFFREFHALGYDEELPF